MTWNDHYRRREAIEAAIDGAREHPAVRPAPETVPAARGLFEDADDLLCALQHTWTQRLTGRLELAAATSDGAEHEDRLAAVRNAWQDTAAANPALRTLLDLHVDTPAESRSPHLREAVARERRMLARAGGLLEAGDDRDEAARVGSTVRKLVRLPAAEAPNARHLARSR